MLQPMLQYVFTDETARRIALGQLKQMMDKSGKLLPIAVDAISGKTVEIARGVGGLPLNPLITPLQFISSIHLINPVGLVTGGVQMYQNHRGFQAVLKGLDCIKTSLGVLQATTAVIGIGTVATVGLSAANLYQTLKLRQDLKALGLEIKDGFIDLKTAFRAQGEEVIAHIDRVAQDVKFEQHKLELVKAYGRFLEASRLIQITLSCDSIEIRNADLANARQTLSEALGIYRNQYLLSETSAAGQLRRLECAWMIEQTIALTYQLQNQYHAVSECLVQLQGKIRQDAIQLINNRQSDTELDFLFPELKRIYDVDLLALNAWQETTNALLSLSVEELQNLPGGAIDYSEDANLAELDIAPISIPPEQVFYEELKQKSHLPSLDLQLQFLVAPALRQEYITYIQQQAAKLNRTSMLSNLAKASDLALANFYWYFKTAETQTVV